MIAKPLRDCLVVKRDEQVTQTASGLFVPTTVEEKAVLGTVLAVGPGSLTSSGSYVPLEVKVGDRVAFNKNLATELTFAGEGLVLLREDQLYCVLSDAV